MSVFNLTEINPRQLMPGFQGRLVHTENVTLAFWEIDADAVLPEHQHPHEQTAIVQEGRFEMTFAGETRILKPGDVAVIPGDTPHSGRALTRCQIIDVFQPVREDYR